MVLPDLLPSVQGLWADYLMLARTRDRREWFGPVSWAETRAYSQTLVETTGEGLSMWEIEALHRLDERVREVVSNKQPPTLNPGGDPRAAKSNGAPVVQVDMSKQISVNDSAALGSMLRGLSKKKREGS